MRLISLEIKNFRVIKNVSLTFPDRVIGIIGPNGAGKSSIIEAIAWALYGHQAARSGKDEIKSTFAANSDTCQVTLEFSVNEERYKVVRRLVGRTERAEVELYRGESSESVGVNETRSYVGQLLGLDWRGFLSSFLARQQELNALSDLQPSKRRDHIAGMLGIERLDKAINKVKEDSRFYQEKSKFLDRQLGERVLVEARLDELAESLRQLEGPIEKASKERKQAETTMAAAQGALEKCQKTRDRWLELKARLDAEQRTANNLRQQDQTLRQEHQELSNNLRISEELAEQIKPVDQVKAQLDQLKETRSQLTLRDELLSRQKELEQQISQATLRLEAATRRKGEFEQKLKGLPGDIEGSLKDAQAALTAARDEYVGVKSELGTARKDAQKLQKQLESVAELGPDSVCDRCARPFGADYDKIKEHLSNELGQLKKVEQKLSTELAASETKGKELAAKVQLLENHKNEGYRLQVDMVSLDGDIEKQSEQLQDYRAKLEQAVRQLEKYASLEFDEDTFRSVASQLAELETLSRRYDQLKGSLARLPAVEKSIADISGKLTTTGEAIKVLTEELSAMGAVESEYQLAVEVFNRARERVEGVARQHQDLIKEKEIAQRELDVKLDQLKGFEKTAQELEQTRSTHYYGEKLAQLFAEYRRDLIASIRPTLADLSSRLFAEMTDSKYSLVELDDKYNLRVMDSGIFYGVDRFSGGEKDLANLCLRLAISLALTESAGLRRSFVILDEVFGSQDNQRKELILRAMGKLKSRFPQILLITHIDDIKDGVEEIIEVLPTGNGWSGVRVNGESI